MVDIVWKVGRSVVEGTSLMSADIYSPCPCGSGKKLKFCCHAIVDDMDRIIRLIDGNQLRVALQQLDVLVKKAPKNAWVGTTRGMLLLDLNEDAAARDVLKSVLEEHPDNELAIVLYAGAMIRAEGFDNAKRAVHRAFQRGAKKLPALVSDLASALATIHVSRDNLMAVREHIALALRLAPEERRQSLFVQLLELDGADEIPYPMRGSHQLPNVTGSEEFEKEVRKAQKYAAVGCWSTAADIFTTLGNAAPERAELWHAAGLCRAWDGDEKNASEALHRAARHYSEIGIAVECETIAQLLDDRNTNDVVEQAIQQAKVSSVSRLLTALDANPRIRRTTASSETGLPVPPVGTYVVLDSEWKGVESIEHGLDNIPKARSFVSVFDANEKTGEPALLVMIGRKGTWIDESKALISSVVGDFLEWNPDPPSPEMAGVSSASIESQVYETHWYLSDEVPLMRRRELFDQFWTSVVNDKWPNQPLRALGGKTPAQAASDESLRIPLLGAIFSLDSAAQLRNRGIGLKRVFDRMGVPPLPQIEVTPEMNLGAMTIMQMHRLPIDKLTDQQLVTVVNRSMLIRHDETLYEVLKIAIDRPACADQFDRQRIIRTLCELASSRGRREEAFSWLERGRQLPLTEGKTAFQQGWTWDMAELSTRLEDPSDPQLKALLRRFVTYYSPKVPQIRPHIEQMLQAFGLPSPWESADIVIATEASLTGGVWNPEAAETVPAGERKLWLPGQ